MKNVSPLYFEASSFEHLNDFLSKRQEKGNQIFVLTDSNVFKSCFPKLLQACPALNEVEVIEIEPGEAQKSIEIATQLWATLLDKKADKNTLIVNVGGGVVTDLGGFIAATLKRGVDYINVPTTLLGAVDAAIGGKTGIDFGHLKNQIGSFYPSKGVYIATDFFDSLSDREFYSGFAECVKHMIIGNARIWEHFVAWEGDYRTFVKEYMQGLAEVKCDIVEIDPKEKNERQFLNYGHTIGHALESYCLDREISITHGNAVVWGMICENKIAEKAGFLDSSLAEEINVQLKKVFTFPQISSEALEPMLEYCTHDKKNENGEIRFAFLVKLGQMKAKQTAAQDHIKSAILETISYLKV